jgi:predicted nucleic acid-binding protein
MTFDDHQACSAATRIGVELIGTAGVLLLAQRNGLTPAVAGATTLHGCD